MEKITLGRSDLRVSRLCLGSMSWGSSNTEAEGHHQIDRCLAAGLNFVDTAEMYPTYPVKAETCGRTEEIIGTWFAATSRRDEVVLATKVAGPNGGFLRDGKGYHGAMLDEAAEGSLRRLQTDVIDLYQLHWPDRGSYHMRQNWRYDPTGQDTAAVRDHMLDVLKGMDRLIRAGKVRHWGLSNETAWGAATWCRLADENGLPRPVSMQNEYSLLCRIADTDMAEACHHENIAFLPFSPLAMGLISGKYGPDTTPPGTRRAAQETLNGRIGPRVWPAVDAYRAIAADLGVDVNAMALAWCMARPFVASPIFGARNDAQLDVALSAATLELSAETMEAIEAAHKDHPMPF